MRTREEEWKLVNFQQWEKNQRIITKIKVNASLLKTNFKMTHSFDLADRLIGIRKKYLWDLNQPTTKERMDQHRKNIDGAWKTGSPDKLSLYDILELEYNGSLQSLGEVSVRTSTRTLRQNIRTLRKRNKSTREEKGPLKQGGWHGNVPEMTVARGLAITYYSGTGKLPSSGHGKSGIRGTYIKFAKRACKLLQIKIPPRRLNTYMLWVRRELIKRQPASN